MLTIEDVLVGQGCWIRWGRLDDCYAWERNEKPGGKVCIEGREGIGR